MNILITGVAGFIGSNLADVLSLQSKYQIIGIDNFDGNYCRKIKEQNIRGLLSKSNFKFVEADVCSEKSMEDIFSDNSIDTVIHLAAKVGVRPSMEAPLEYIETNVKGTAVILEAMRRNNVSKMIFASSSSIYGANTKVPFSESDSTENIISVYAATKLAAEQLNKLYHDVYGFSIINLRFFTVYGERQRPDLAIHKFFSDIMNGKSITIYGAGDTSRDYTYVGDIVSGISSAIEYINKNDNVFEITNLGNNKPVNILELVKKIELITGVQANILYKPLPSGDVIKTYADISKAKMLLSYFPKVNIDEGLTHFYKSYIQNKAN